MAKKKISLPAPPPDHDDDSFPLNPTPRTSITTIVLCALNMLAAVVFIYIATLDLEKRRAWSHACFLLEMIPNGLPLEDENKGDTGVQEEMPKAINNPDDLKKAFDDRKPGEKVKENFQAVDVRPIPRTKPSDLDDPRKLAQILGDDKNLVASLEAECRRLKDSVLMDISAAAALAAKVEATSDERRQTLHKALLPLARDSFQILELDKLVKELDEDKLIDMLIETYERRMILDILRPIEFHRPGDKNRPYLDLTNPRDLNLKELKEKLVKRLDNAAQEAYDGELYYVKELAGKKRDAAEKRANIVFMLFTIAHVLRPDGKTLVFEKGPERVQNIIGVYAFAAAAEEYVEAIDRFAKRLIKQIDDDREGKLIVLANDDAIRTDSFKTRYPTQVKMILDKINEIETAKSSLALKQAERDAVKKAYYDGVADVAAKEVELRSERNRTAQLLLQLQTLQARLFRSQLELSTAASDNEGLAREIREIEAERHRIENLVPAKGKVR